MGPVLAVVRILGWDLDNINVGMFCWICRPLGGDAGPVDTGDNTMEEFEFQYEEMVKRFISFPNPHPCVKDSFLVLMEEIQCGGYLGESTAVD